MSSAGAARARRWPRAGRGQRPLLWGSLMVLAGSFMPWLATAVGGFSGVLGPGLWTFYASALGIAGSLVPSRTAATLQAAVLAVVAVALPVWQLVHIISLVGFEGWLPGPGLVLVAGGGVLAGSAALRLHRGTD